MNTKTVSLYSAIVLASAATGYYLTPTKTVIKTEIKEVIKEVEKKTEDSAKKTQKNKVYIKVETILPDGTRRIETKIVDNGTITIDTSASSETTKESEKNEKTEKTVERTSPTVIYGLGSVNLTNVVGGIDYGIGVQKQILGPFWTGLQFQKSGTFGVTLGIGF
jgi:hypothetical protein